MSDDFVINSLRRMLSDDVEGEQVVPMVLTPPATPPNRLILPLTPPQTPPAPVQETTLTPPTRQHVNRRLVFPAITNSPMRFDLEPIDHDEEEKNGSENSPKSLKRKNSTSEDHDACKTHLKEHYPKPDDSPPGPGKKPRITPPLR